MKLLLAASLFPPETRGPATFAGQLDEHLKLKHIPMEVVLFRDVRQVPPLFRHLIYTGRLIVRGWGSSAVLALDPVSVGLPALLAATVLRAKLIIRIGGDYAWEQGLQRSGVTDLLDDFLKKNKWEYGVLVALLWRIQCFVARRASRVVVPSNYLKRVVEQWGVEPKKISVIGSAAAPARASLSKKDTRQRVGWGTEPIIFSAGALVPWKGFGVLIDAFAILKRDIPEARLIIVGNGPERELLRARAQSRGLDPDMILSGEMPHIILRELMHAADVFALNTGYEGLSHQLLEAMQGGVPIITTPAGGNAELIEHKKTGLLVPFNDTQALVEAIRDCIVHPAAAHKRTAAAKAAAAVFTPEKSMQAWEKLLKKVCAY